MERSDAIYCGAPAANSASQWPSGCWSMNKSERLVLRCSGRAERMAARQLPLASLFLVLAACLVTACGGDDDGDGGGGGELARVSAQDTAGVPSAFLEYGVQKG